MVRLEGERGAVWVNPQDVAVVEASVLPGFSTVTLRLPQRWFVVKGTPDEVHALLFPEVKP